MTDVAPFFNSTKFIYVPKGLYNQTETIKIPANTKVYFEPGSVLIWNMNSKKNAIEFSDNVNFEASGCTFNMVWDANLPFPDDDDKGPFHLALYGVRNVIITGGNYLNATIDCIYVGMRYDPTTRVPCENITIQNVICKQGRRQGMSVVAVKNLVVRNSQFSMIKGTPPQAGIDIEPNAPADPVSPILISGCIANQNASHSYIVNLSRFNTTSPPLDIKFENCTAKNFADADAIKVVGMGVDSSHPPKGKISFNNSFIWENT